MAKQIIMENEDALFGSSQQLPFLSLNHVSFMCRSVHTSAKFYTDVLGFVLIRRPSSFDFKGAWLFNHGIGIHLLEMETTPTKKATINPKDNHISFQCTNMDLIIKKLEEMGIKYVTAVVKEGGVEVDQLFFHDPDGYMIEICNCHVLPVLPITSCPLKKRTPTPQINYSESSFYGMLLDHKFTIYSQYTKGLVAQQQYVGDPYGEVVGSSLVGDSVRYTRLYKCE